MSDDYASSETGVQRLLAQLGKSHPRYAEALTLQWRLLDNISQARRYGDTETRSAGRAQIVDVLNQLALETTGQSFNELCGLARDEPMPTIPVEPSEPPPPRTAIQVIIPEDEIPDFTQDRRDMLLGVLASVLQVEPSDIRILRVLQGSIRVIIEVPKEAVTRLKSLSSADKIKLARLGVQAIEGDNVRLVLPNIPTVPIISGLYAWYHSLAPALQVAIIVALIGLFGTLAGSLGAPVVEWLLERPTPTAVAAATSTPTPTVTPTVSPTHTSTSTPTFTSTPSPTNILTPTPTGTRTPTPTPDCSGVRVEKFILHLSTGVGQEKYPDEENVIDLTREDIISLGSLSGQAILTDADDCTCWIGGTPTPTSDCSFEIILSNPAQVTSIPLLLTVDGQAPQLFTFEISE